MYFFCLVMSKKYFSIKDFDYSGKRVLVRVDYNVPLDEKGRVVDDFRIRESLPTIEYIVRQGGVPIVVSHLGRPTGVDENLRLDGVARALQRLTKYKVVKCDDTVGENVEKTLEEVVNGTIVLLENIRFYAGEEENDLNFARRLADLADYVVLDAFGVMHRAHASVVGVQKYLPSAAGFLVEKEIEMLSMLDKPKRPYVVVWGGKKISDKIDVIKVLRKKADLVLVGGAMTCTFLRAVGYDMGASFVEDTKLGLARALYKKGKMALPSDVVVAKSPNKKGKNVDKEEVLSSDVIYDIGPATRRSYCAVLKKAKTVFWNGPMGLFEKKEFSHGSREMANCIVKYVKTSIIGGGETADMIKKFGLERKFSHVSTGGGAALEFLCGKLPGIVALEKNYKKFKKRLK